MILALDPSINDLGLAVLDERGDYMSSQLLNPEPTRTKDPVAKIDSLFEQLCRHMEQAGPYNEIIIEHTRFFARNHHTSHASAQKLNLVKGVLYGLCKAKSAGAVHLVRIPHFSKDKANLVARACHLPENISQHERDAFWLGNTWHHSPQILRQQYLLTEE